MGRNTKAKRQYKLRADALKQRRDDERWAVRWDGASYESFFTYSGKPSKHLDFAREHRAYRLNDWGQPND